MAKQEAAENVTDPAEAKAEGPAAPSASDAESGTAPPMPEERAAEERDAAQEGAEERAAAADEQTEADERAAEERAEGVPVETEVVGVGEPGVGQAALEVPVGEGPGSPAFEAEEYTVLVPMNRHGELLAPGSTVTFEEDEAQHAADLVAARAVYPGTGEDAEAALEEARRLRDVARRTPPA
jgi:hypothetical protein